MSEIFGNGVPDTRERRPLLATGAQLVPVPTEMPALERPTFQTPIDIYDFSKRLDAAKDEYLFGLVVETSKGKITRRQIHQLEQDAEITSIIKKITGRIPAEIVFRVISGDVGNDAEKYLAPGVVSPADIARIEQRELEIRNGTRLSDARQAADLDQFAAAVAAAARRLYVTERLLSLAREARLFAPGEEQQFLDELAAALPPDP